MFTKLCENKVSPESVHCSLNFATVVFSESNNNNKKTKIFLF